MRKTPAPLSAAIAKPIPAVKPTAGTTATLEKKPAPRMTATAKTPAPATKPAVKPKPIAAAAVKTLPVKAQNAKAAPPAPKAVAETHATYFAGAAGRAWRMSGKHAVAYVHTAALAGELLQTEPRQVAGSAMAIYYDRKGRPFAWQFRFDAARWAEVTGRLL